ncbi:hypothetical protein POM88_012558 [Heracleum sosnowskyi]|uniref:CRAL-TRIO domain-containing protein n=1 Tax=Heracleum sosnowskyi TaxID=360622 RepID=A0AAD8IWQ2_9APIA|nr:hypothetical protein POM88_012558 [Heracleum sosnowskyi]
MKLNTESSSSSSMKLEYPDSWDIVKDWREELPPSPFRWQNLSITECVRDVAYLEKNPLSKDISNSEMSDLLPLLSNVFDMNTNSVNPPAYDLGLTDGTNWTGRSSGMQIIYVLVAANTTLRRKKKEKEVKAFSEVSAVQKVRLQNWTIWEVRMRGSKVYHLKKGYYREAWTFGAVDPTAAQQLYLRSCWGCAGSFKKPAQYPAKRHIDSIIIIFDVQGVEPTKFAGCLGEVMDNMKLIDTNYYPKTLHRMFIVNAGPVFWIAWNIICKKGHIDPTTLSKIQVRFVAKKYQKKLLEVIDKSELSEFLGGSLSDTRGCLRSDKGPPYQSYIEENEAFLTTADSAIKLLPETTKSVANTWLSAYITQDRSGYFIMSRSYSSSIIRTIETVELGGDQVVLLFFLDYLGVVVDMVFMVDLII